MNNKATLRSVLIGKEETIKATQEIRNIVAHPHIKTDHRNAHTRERAFIVIPQLKMSHDEKSLKQIHIHN